VALLLAAETDLGRLVVQSTVQSVKVLHTIFFLSLRLA
jgi:hypothetical protein